MSSNLERTKTTQGRNPFGKLQGEIDAISECSMCGDVGIEEELFQCQACFHRLQHRYCSRLYPHTVLETWICDWCLHEQELSNGEKIEQPTSRIQVPSMEIKRSPVHGKCKDHHAGSEAASADPFEHSDPEDSAERRQRKRKLSRTEKILQYPRYRYRYKSLAKLL